MTSYSTSAGLLRCLSQPRLDGYATYCNNDADRTLELYQWNTQIAGAFWETLGHLEVALRNTIAERLADRHQRLGRPGTWLDDAHRDLDQRARGEIAEARQRVRRNHKKASDGQTISELNFGFWRYLLVKRYTALWPDIASGFPNSPDRRLTTIERPVADVHALRNRIAHHQRIWTEPLSARWSDVADLLHYIDADLAGWAIATSRVPTLLVNCPVIRPHP